MASPGDTERSPRALTIGIIAGEMSGDLIGAGLMRSLRQHFPDAQFIGIGGAAMTAEGLQSQVPMERLSVMGVVEVLKRLRELLRIRRNIVDLFLNTRIDVFIGIDSPDFNLPIARMLHVAGIKTVHYVSPTVWAWRQKRVLSIKASVDLMLVLFPFEADFYKTHRVPVVCVGHPFAHQIPRQLDHAQVRDMWGFAGHERVVAVLPGSRGGELKFMGPLFIDVMKHLSAIDPKVRFIMPCANAARREQFERQWSQSGAELPLTLVTGHARDVMAAADVVLVTSGTATLEAMLLKRPMVVAYRWGAITHAIISRLVKTPYIALPNILAGQALVPEFLQSEAQPEAIVSAIRRWIDDADARNALTVRFDAIHDDLSQDADALAADAIAHLLQDAADWQEARDAAGL